MASSFKDIMKESFDNFLDESAIEIQSQIVKNIEDGKDYKRKSFKALKKSTKDERGRKGYGRSKPILIRTGGLKDSIRVKADKVGKSVAVSSTLSYANDLNDGNHSGWWGIHAINVDMPPREFLGIPKSLELGSKRRNVIQDRNFNIMEDRIISSMNTRLEKVGLKI